MLRHLSIRHFAVVDAVDLDFHAGFTALTGETGAGKSILIDALALALGERADADMVQVGAERAEIAAEFSLEREPLRRWLAEQALEGDADRLLLRRVLDRGGRSRAFINGHAATLAQLRDDLDTALSFQPPHLSIYHLTLEPNTYFAKYPPQHMPDEDVAYEMLDLITERTAQAGLQRYEVSG